MDSDDSSPGDSFRKKPELSVLSGGLRREKTVVEFEDDVLEPERRLSSYDPALQTEQRQFKVVERIPDPAQYRAPVAMLQRKESEPAILEIAQRDTLPSIAHPAAPVIKDKHVRELRAATAKSRSLPIDEEDAEVKKKRNGLALVIGIVFGVGGLALALVGMALVWLARIAYFSLGQTAVVVGAVLLVIGVLLFVAGCTVYHIFFKKIFDLRKKSGDRTPITKERQPVHFPVVGKKNNELPPLELPGSHLKRKKLGLKRRASKLSIESDARRSAVPKSPRPLSTRVHPEGLMDRPSWR